MNRKTLRSIVALLVLAGMLLTPLTAVARLVGNEFAVVRYSFHEAWTGNIAYEASYNKYAIAWAEQSQLAYYAEPYVGWVAPGSTAVTSHRVAAMTTHSSSTPDISCGIAQRCLVTWVSNAQVFARIVRPDGTMGPIWRVDTGQPALRSVLTPGPLYYLIAWEMEDGRIAMRHVDRDTGPLDAVAYVQLPAGCTRGRNVQVTGGSSTYFYGIAYECADMVHLEVRKDVDLSYLWWRTPEMPNTDEYGPEIIAYWATDSGDTLLLAYQTVDPDLGIFGQRYDRYGNALGLPFAIAPSGSQKPHFVENHITQEIVAVYEQGDDIHLKRMSHDGAAVGIPYAITSAAGRQYAPRISEDVWNQHLVVWTDLRDGLTEGDIYAHWIETEPVLGYGGPLDNELPDSGTSFYQAPALMSQWLAIGIRPSLTGDLDLYLTDSPDYGTVLASSIYGTGLADIVVIDGYQPGPPAHFPYVQHFAGDTYYSIEFAPRVSRITEQRPTISQETLAVESVARMFDIYGLPGQLLDIRVAPDVPDLAIALFDPRNGPQQALNQALLVADSGGGGHAEVLQYVPDTEGWYGLLVWKTDDTAGAFNLSANGAGQPPGDTIYLPLVTRSY